jgi:uncharacterized protein YuzE
VRLKVDRAADALYLTLDDSAIVGSEEVAPGVVVDFNETGDIVGIEMLYLSRRAPQMNAQQLVFETVGLSAVSTSTAN